MAKYKITCNDMSFLSKSLVGNDYHGATFEGVAITEDKAVAEFFKNCGYHRGGKTIFNVEELAKIS